VKEVRGGLHEDWFVRTEGGQTWLSIVSIDGLCYLWYFKLPVQPQQH
jgi:hypothetical protein